MSTRVRLLTLALASLLVFAACGDDDSSGGDGGGSGDASTTAVESALFSDDLESVCRGVAQPRAKAHEFDIDIGTVHRYQNADLAVRFIGTSATN